MIKKLLNDLQRHIKFHGFFWTKHLLCALAITLPMVYFFKLRWQSIFLVYFLWVLFYHVRQIQKLNLSFKQYLGYEDVDDEYLSFADLKQANPSSDLWQEIYYFLNKHDLKHNKKQQKLQKKYQNFVQAIEASPNGVMIIRHNGEILWFNQMICQFLQLKKEDGGKNIYGLLRQPKFHEYLKQIYQKIFNEAGEEEINFDHDFAKYSPPIIQLGHYFLKIEWVFIDHGRALLIFRDMTEIQQLEHARRDFLNHISHELSTPLTVILSYSETLLDILPQNGTHEMIDSIHQRARDMNLLIKDLLLMNKLEADQKKQSPYAKPQPLLFLSNDNHQTNQTNQTNQINESNKDFKQRLNYLIEQCQQLNTNIQIDFHDHVKAKTFYAKNRNRYIDTIFNNLIQNALFYSENNNINNNINNNYNNITINDLNHLNNLNNLNDSNQYQGIRKKVIIEILEIIDYGDLLNISQNKTNAKPTYQASYFFNLEQIHSEHFLKIQIIDEGIGIEAIHLPLIIQSFYRVDESRTHLSGGTGLGLALVAQVLENIGGALQIESSFGLGSCFTVYLPIQL